MRENNSNKTVEVVDSEKSAESYLEIYSESQAPKTHRTYHELADIPVVEVDALAQLHMNLMLLRDLQGRLAFVMREVRYLMKV